MSNLTIDPYHILALRFMMLDFLLDKDGLGMEELRIILKQFIDRRGALEVSLSLVPMGPLDGIFRRGSSLVGVLSKVRIRDRVLRRHAITLKTIVHGSSGAIKTKPILTRAERFPSRITCHYNESLDRLFILYEGSPQLVIINVSGRRVEENYIIMGLPSGANNYTSRPTMFTDYGKLFIVWRLETTCTIFEIELAARLLHARLLL